MLSDWFGRSILAVTAAAIVVVGWAIWADLHDGKRCIETRFSHFQTMIIGKAIVNQPVYKCVRWIEDPNS